MTLLLDCRKSKQWYLANTEYNYCGNDLQMRFTYKSFFSCPVEFQRNFKTTHNVTVANVVSIFFTQATKILLQVPELSWLYTVRYSPFSQLENRFNSPTSAVDAVEESHPCEIIWLDAFLVVVKSFQQTHVEEVCWKSFSNVGRHSQWEF